MVTSARYDTTCPNCSQTFEVEETLTEGNCPSCGVHLRFLEEAPPPPPDMPTLAPEPSTMPFAAEPPAPTNGDGGFAVQCPQCTHTFSVTADTAHGNCPQCNTSLNFEDQFPRAIEAFVVRCPSCGATTDVSADARHMSCSHCGSALQLEDVFPGQEARLESAPSAPAKAPETPPVFAPEAAEKPGRGRFRRFTRAPAEPQPGPVAPEAEPETEAEPTPALESAPDSNLPPPVKVAPPGGFPYVLSCPTCQREFSVSPKEHEGNCPHCNAPLAFLTEKEYDALIEAEARKRAFQAKLQQRRLERKKRDEERLQRESATAPERNLLKRLRPGKKAEPAAETSTTPPALTPLEPPKRKWTMPWASKSAETPTTPPPTQPPVPQEAAPAPIIEQPAPAPKRGKSKKAPKPEVAPAAVETEVPVAEVQVAPATPGAPTKKGLLARFARKRPAAESPAPAAAFESAPIEMAGFDVAPSPAAGPAKPSAPTKAKGMKAPPPTTEPAVVEPAGIEMGDVEVAASSTAPPAAPKSGFLSRFGRKKGAPEPASAPATVEASGFEIGDVVASAPRAPTKEPKKSKAKKAPARVAAVEAPAAIEFESSVEAPAASPATPAPKKGLLSRFKREKAPAGPAAVVEEGDIEIGNGMGPTPADAASIELSAETPPAPKKRRK